MSGGESDLQRLLGALSPVLSLKRYAFEEAAGSSLDALTFALIREDEGITAVREEADGGWARISLSVHSSLEAVGLTAVLSRRLADAGISANVVAGLRHDYLFVPWERREEALDLLRSLSS